MIYRVTGAEPGHDCDSMIHTGHPVPAVVTTNDDRWRCPIHWWTLADELTADGHQIHYSASARARLGLGG